jgi:hypothetical protein
VVSLPENLSSIHRQPSLSIGAPAAISHPIFDVKPFRSRLIAHRQQLAV